MAAGGSFPSSTFVRSRCNPAHEDASWCVARVSPPCYPDIVASLSDAARLATPHDFRIAAQAVSALASDYLTAASASSPPVLHAVPRRAASAASSNSFTARQVFSNSDSGFASDSGCGSLFDSGSPLRAVFPPEVIGYYVSAAGSCPDLLSLSLS